MAKKKRARKKAIRLSRIFPAGVLLLLIGAAVALFVLNSRKGEPPESKPAYEEAHVAAAAQPLQEIERINRAVYESLYRNNIPEKDIRFLAVEPERERDNGWEFTELLVACRDRKRAAQIAITIEKALSALDSAIEFRMTERTENELIYRVGVGGMPTHKLIFSVGRRLPPAAKRPRVAIIVDDLGYDRDIAFSFMRLNLKLTLSILPHAPFTRSVAREAAKRGFETLLHLPMEPKGYPSVQPGAGALLLEMSDGEVVSTLASNLEQIPGVRGVNNHMGSVYTENHEKMGLVLRELKRRNLFYVDSRTSGRTVAFETAQEMGLPSAVRNVFLDNDLDPHAIQIQIERLKGLARQLGDAVGIAHPFKETLDSLRESASELSSEAEVVPVSELVSVQQRPFLR